MSVLLQTYISLCLQNKSVWKSVPSYTSITSSTRSRGLKRSRKCKKKYHVFWQERLDFWCRFRYFKRGEGTKVWKRFKIPPEEWWKGNRGMIWERGKNGDLLFLTFSEEMGWLNIQFDIRWVFNSPDTEWAAAAVVLYVWHSAAWVHVVTEHCRDI